MRAVKARRGAGERVRIGAGEWVRIGAGEGSKAPSQPRCRGPTKSCTHCGVGGWGGAERERADEGPMRQLAQTLGPG